jgi:3-dehydroquinate dehydratase-2
MRVLVLNGPNLNLLGTRERQIYGAATLADVEKEVGELAAELGVEVSFAQSNHEGALVDLIQQAGRDGIDHVIINPGAYTHTSIAIRDAFTGVGVPFVEVHISNVHAREDFRRHSHLSSVATAVIAGAGTLGYSLALRLIHARPTATR